MSTPVGISPLPSPPIITAASRVALGGMIARAVGGSAASGVSPWSDAANCLLAFPFKLEAPTTFYKGFVIQGSSGANATNWEVGIWDAAYTKIVTTGSYAGDANNDAPKTAALSATTSLPPGLYYAGCAHNATTTNQIHRWSTATTGIGIWQAYGCWRQAAITLGSLGATATPGDMSNVAFPLFGLITRSVADV